MKGLKFTLFIILLILIGLSVTLLIIESFTDKGKISLNNYTMTFSRRSNIRSFERTIYLAIFTSLFAGFVGATSAWLVARTNLPGRRILRTILVVPFMVPPFIGAMGWMFFLGRGGYLNKLWMSLFGREFYDIHTFSGIVLVLGMYLYPLVFLNVASALEKMDPSLEEAARMCGAKVGRIMKDISLPLVLPSILSGMLLVFASAAANFGVPAIIGMPGRVYVLTTKIMSYLYGGTITGLRRAVALSVALIGVAVIGLILNNILTSKSKFTIITGKYTRPLLVDLKGARWIGYLLWAFAIIAVFVPMFSIFLTALWKAWGLPFKLSSFTFSNFTYVLFKYSETKRAIANSFLYAIIAATITTIIGALVAYTVKKQRDPMTKIMEFLSTIPQAIPGTVVAVAMILTWSGKLKINLYNTVWIIILAYIARYLFFSVRTVTGGLSQIHSSLEEAARSSGAKELRVARDITFPLLWPSLFASWVLIFMPTLRELTISILLYGPHTKTIGVAIYELQDAGEYEAASAMATIVLIITFTLQVIMNAITKRKKRGDLA